jgi:hypothetical protein
MNMKHRRVVHIFVSLEKPGPIFSLVGCDIIWVWFDDRRADILVD